MNPAELKTALKAIIELTRNPSEDGLLKLVKENKEFAAAIASGDLEVPEDLLDGFSQHERNMIVVGAVAGLLDTVHQQIALGGKPPVTMGYYNPQTGTVSTKEEMEAMGFTIAPDGSILSGPGKETGQLSYPPPKPPGLKTNGPDLSFLTKQHRGLN